MTVRNGVTVVALAKLHVCNPKIERSSGLLAALVPVSPVFMDIAWMFGCTWGGRRISQRGATWLQL